MKKRMKIRIYLSGNNNGPIDKAIAIDKDKAKDKAIAIDKAIAGKYL